VRGRLDTVAEMGSPAGVLDRHPEAALRGTDVAGGHVDRFGTGVGGGADRSMVPTRPRILPAIDYASG
jgi:hypothetical protein